MPSYKALTTRVGTTLNFAGKQSVESIVTGLGLTAATLANTQDRHDNMMSVANGILGDIQNADPYEVGVKLTTLQTQLEAELPGDGYAVADVAGQLSVENFTRQRRPGEIRAFSLARCAERFSLSGRGRRRFRG